MSLAAKMVALFGRRAFNISPAVSGKTTWDLANDGPLNLSTAGTWTITPLGTFLVSAKVWGAGAAGTGFAGETGGAGGYAGGYVLFLAGASYTLYVGAPSVGTTGGAPGGASTAAGVGTGSGGGGYSGLRLTGSGTGVLIAGGGGGSGHPGAGGAGGGLTGQDGSLFSGTIPGHGGTQSAGGAPGDSGQAGSAYQGGAGLNNFGGGGGGGYYGGGGSGVPAGTVASGAGGGSGYANPQYVTQSTLTTGNLNTPGNSADSDRGSSGNEGTAGRVKLV